MDMEAVRQSGGRFFYALEPAYDLLRGHGEYALKMLMCRVHTPLSQAFSPGPTFACEIVNRFLRAGFFMS